MQIDLGIFPDEGRARRKSERQHQTKNGERNANFHNVILQDAKRERAGDQKLLHLRAMKRYANRLVNCSHALADSTLVFAIIFPHILCHRIVPIARRLTRQPLIFVGGQNCMHRTARDEVFHRA